jgi:hypothetical protein
MQISAAIGLAALGTISTGHTASLTAQGVSLSAALTSGYQLSFGIASMCVAAGLLVVLVVLRPRGTRQDAPVTRREFAEGTAEAA